MYKYRHEHIGRQSMCTNPHLQAHKTPSHAYLCHTNVLTCENGKLQTRAGKLWSQTEATYKQVNNLSTELSCFKELQKQERLAASYRINNLLDEVNKQKTLESQLQCQYGDLLSESERLQNLLEEHKRKVAAENTEPVPTEEAEEMKVDNDEVAGVENDDPQVAATSEVNEDTVKNTMDETVSFEKDYKLTTENVTPEKDAENTMDGPVSDAGDAGIAPGEDSV
jgi:DNA repair ATPase RecN